MIPNMYGKCEVVEENKCLLWESAQGLRGLKDNALLFFFEE